MSDSANPVREFKNHLREAGALIASRRYDEASRHVDAALALDPASLAALTLRERIQKGRAGSTGGRVAAPRTPSSSMPAADAPAAANPPRFIPSGVNAASWLDFEQRIQERRFRALVDTAQRAVAAGNGVAARAAIEEARELHPDSGELSHLSGRAALLPVVPPGSHDRYARSRTMRAASMLLFGVTLLLGLDWLRSDTVADVTSASAFPDSLGPSIESLPGADVMPEPEILSRLPTVALPEASEDASGSREDEYVLGTAGEAIDQEAPAPPAVALPPSRPLSTRAAAAPVALPPTVRRGEVADDYVAPAARDNTREAAVSNPPNVPAGETPDNYVAPVRREPAPARETFVQTPREPLVQRPGSAPAASTAANVVRQPGSIVESLGTTRNEGSPTPSVPAPTPAAARPAAAAIVSTRAADQTLVESALQQYARAFGRLDARAARAIWPTVDEPALARAFADLESQNVSFDRCDIAVDGATATASCRGKQSYVGKVGSRRSESRTWKFDLMRDGDSWKIAKAETRR